MTWQPPRLSAEEREPRRIVESLGAVTRRLGIPDPGVLGAVFARWNELVGEDVAAHAKPISLRAGTLVIEVDEPAWATQLRYLSEEVLARLRDATGPDGISELQVRVSPTPAPRRRSRPSGSRRDTPL